MIFKKKKDSIEIKKELIDYYKGSIKSLEIEENNIIRNCNTMIISNSIMLIPLVFGIITCLKELSKVRTMVLIFGLILIALIMVGTFFSILAVQIYKSINNKSIKEELIDEDVSSSWFLDQTINDLENVYDTKIKNNKLRGKLLLVSHIIIYSFYVLLFIFGMVIMILL